LPPPGDAPRGLSAAFTPRDPLVAALDAAFARLTAAADESAIKAAIHEIVGLCYQRFRAMSHNMLRRYPHVRAQYGTSDVLHETYPDIEKTLRKLRFDSPVAFFRCVGKNIRWTLKDLGRKIRRRPVAAGGGLSDVPGAAGDPADAVAWADAHAWVGRLPAADRLLFDLICYCGLTQAEAAAHLGKCARTIRRKWVVLRLKFKRKFPGTSLE
jgi:DNA-directed RNA polymerase specialized sigma24 family protein